MKFLLLGFYLICTSLHAWGPSQAATEFASPVTTKARYVLLAGSLATLTFALLEDKVGDPLQKDVVNDRPLGKFSIVGDLAGQMIPNAAYAIGHFAWGENKRSLGMVKATGYASVVTTVLKYTVREPRPHDHSIRNSFPSGHSTTAFAFSGYVWQEHGWQWGSAALALSSFTAFSRINDNKHYLHDVIAGATIGFSYGLAISMLEKNKVIDENSVMLFPVYGLEIKGLLLSKNF